MPTFEITTPDGRVFDITGETQEGALAALKDHLGDNGQEQSAPKTEVDTSMGGAMQYGYDNAGKLIGKGIQGFGELTGSDTMQTYGKTMAERNEQEIAQSNYQRPDGADGIVKNLREGDLLNAGKSLAYGAAEAAPQMAGGIVASSAAMVSSPVIAGGLLVGGTAYGITSAMGENKSEKEEKGLDADATASDLTAAVMSGALEILPVKGGGATLKILKEGAQEAGQEGLVIGNTAIQGGAYVPDEILNRMGDAGIIGSTLAGATNTAITTVNKAGEVVFKPREELAPEVDQAAGDVARMLRETADGSGFNLKDINPSSLKGADETMNAVRRTIHSEVKSAADQIRKQVVKDLDPETLEKFNNIVKASNQKVGSGVTVQEIQLVKDLAGSTEFGQKMVNGLYKSNALTEVYASGLKGGVSQFTDAFNPFQNVGRSYGIGGSTIAGAFSGSSAFYSGGATLGLAAGGRAIDAVTGRRSKVNRFVQKNAKKGGLATPVGIELPQSKSEADKETKDQMKADRLRYNAEQDNKKFDQARNRMRYNAELQNKKFDKNRADEAVKKAEAKAKLDRDNAKDVADAKEKALTARLNVRVNKERGAVSPDSPQGFIMQQTGLDWDGVDLALIRLKKNNPNDPDVSEMIARYKQMLESGYKESGKTLTPLKNMLVNTIENDPQLKKLKKKLAKANKKKVEIDPRVQKGIDENKKRLSELKASMEADMSISNSDKAVLDKAFKELSKTLGTNPVAMAKLIIKKAKADMDQPTKINQYLKPYLDRVKAQQIKPKVNIQPQ